MNILVLTISTGGPAESYQAGAFNSFTIPEFLTPFQQTALLIGMTYLPPFVLHSAMSRDQTWLNASVPALIFHVTSPQLKSNGKLPRTGSSSGQ